jgi:hypothetical protein
MSSLMPEWVETLSEKDEIELEREKVEFELETGEKFRRKTQDELDRTAHYLWVSAIGNSNCKADTRKILRMALKLVDEC